jgi:hypothetical protein
MGNTEMIKVLEEEKRKAVEKLDVILRELKRLEEEKSNISDNIDENSQIMENDLIFTSAGELLNTTNKKLIWKSQKVLLSLYQVKQIIQE